MLESSSMIDMGDATQAKTVASRADPLPDLDASSRFIAVLFYSLHTSKRKRKPDFNVP